MLSALDHYFDLVEHIILRSSLVVFLLLAVRRLIALEWKKR